jgi:hypothetical protein
MVARSPPLAASSAVTRSRTSRSYSMISKRAGEAVATASAAYRERAAWAL